jgi:hypothetical protein
MKIYRLHTAPATNTDWHETSKLNAKLIDSIKDGAAGHYSIPVTSIPSPFGRVFLVKNAFEKVNVLAANSLANLEGTTIYHRLVSETLDMAELLFNIDNLRDAGVNIDILEWNKADKLAQLRATHSDQHTLLARTLDLFWQDAMGTADKIYIIRKDFKVLGGTSTHTLFFTTPNEENFRGAAPIKMGNDVLFDYSFNPLYKRDKAFQIFLYTWIEANPILKVKMPLFAQYLTISLNALTRADAGLHQELMAITHQGQAVAAANLLANYTTIDVAGPATPILLDAGIFMYKAKAGTVSGESSDFMIGSYEHGQDVNSKSTAAQKPLLLQNKFGLPLKYWGGTWDSKTEVPAYDEKPIGERILPGMHTKYPYLTVSDFLAPQLLELPYTLDSTRFFDGHAQGFVKGSKQDNVAPDKSFLLPINRIFFEYFDAADLQRTLVGGEKAFTMTKIDANSVKVVLRIPVKATNQYITLERVYTRDIQPDLKQNKGAIVAAAVNVGFFPFLRDVADKRVVIMERETDKQQPYEVKFYRQNSTDFIAPTQNTLRSSLQKGHYANSNYLMLDQIFDYLTITKDSQTGLLLPVFPTWQQGAKQYTFAIDFGTTNSHIEYSEGGATPKPFDINEADVQLVTMHDSNWEVTPRELQSYFLYEMMPTTIGKEFKFPTRTALAEAEGLQFSGALMTYGDFNPAMYYQKYKNIPQSLITTNLKWANVTDDNTHEKRVRAYIESLLIMVRNKVLLGGGSLQNTRIIWFYPTSMSHFVMTGLENIWNDMHRKYFPTAHALVRYSESEAPYYYRAGATQSVQPSVNIDMGGGSTDVVVFQNEKARVLSSFRFAGNALFSTGYIKGPSLENGFVKAFQPVVDRFLSENYYKLFDLNEVHGQLKDASRNYSSDLMSFFFSLDSKSHSQLVANNLDFTFTRILAADTDFKIMYYLFFGCQMFHIAQLMKAEGLPLPQHIFFSGNASKILSVLDISTNWASLSKVARIIFEKVYGTEFHSEGIQIHRNAEPKEATCRGGIQKLSSPANAAHIAIKNTVLVGDESQTAISETAGIFEGNRTKYEGIDDALKQSVVEEVRRCLKILLLEVPNIFNLGIFGIPIGKMESYYSTLDSNLAGYLQAGLNDRLASTDKAETIGETLFFYPLIGALHKLGLAIASKQV